MVKEPRPGKVKTRLGRGIGLVPAAWWFRHQVRRLFRRLRGPRWDLILAVSPDAEGLSSRVWPFDLPRLSQGHGDLGDRMSGVFRRLSGPVCIIGADIPGITPAKIADAFKSLGPADAVFGPAPDGGYWLIGLRTGFRPAGLLDDVRWSGPHALEDSIASLGNARVAKVATLQDVDEVEDLDRP